MSIIKNSKDLKIENLVNWNELNNASICFSNDEHVLDDQDWSDFMKENHTEFLGADESYYFYKTSEVIIAIPVASDIDNDVYLDVKNAKDVRKWDAFKLEDCSVDIDDNFFDIIKESLSEYNLNNIEDALDCSVEDSLDALQFGVYDAIESCVYNVMRDIITYHANDCFDNDDMDNNFLDYIINFEKEVDDMHDLELMCKHSSVIAYKDESGKDFLSVEMVAIAGIAKSIKINLDAFESEEAKSKLQVQLDNLTKEIIQESPYNLMKRLYIEK